MGGGNKKQTFLRKSKRFFEPVRLNKGVTFYLVLYFTAQYSLGIVFIFFIKHVTEALELGVREEFYFMLWSYLGIFIGATFITFALHRGWIYSYNRYQEFLEKRYLPKYIQFDMNSYERVGTGKSVAIISKGFKMWCGLIDRMLIEVTGLIISVGITLYLLSQVNSLLVGLLIFLLFIGLNVGLFLNKKASKIRIKRIELDNIWSRRLVKIIMAKVEILQSSRIKEEIGELHKLHEGQIYYNGKMAFYIVPFFIIGSIIIMVLLFFVFFVFWRFILRVKNRTRLNCKHHRFFTYDANSVFKIF